jgi:hypothetical protein
MLSLLSALTITMLAAAPASTTGNTWVSGGRVYVRFYDLSKIYGPVKFYVGTNAYPGAGCQTCPSGTTAEYVVPPEMVYQTWPQGGKYLEVSFPCACVGNMEQFCFTAVSCLSDEERFLATGDVPTLLAKGGRNK